jgi:LCP family protein required for cell wall assembly
MDNKEKKPIGRILLRIAGVLLCVVLVGALAAGLFLNSLLGKINRPTDEPTLSPEEIEAILADPELEDIWQTVPVVPETENVPETVPVQTEPEATESLATVPPETEPAQTEPEAESEGKIVNILLIGQDRRQSQSRQRSDSMILCTVNTEKKTLLLTSFLRDMYVEFPMHDGWKYKDNRINVAYILGGMGLLDATLKHNFGVDVDYNVEVDFSGFQDIINLLGGIEMDITQKEADWMNKQLERDEFTEGVNVLDGSAALFYARIRKIDSDFDRSNRQKKILSAVLDEVRGVSLLELVKLSNEVMPMITTDMPVEVMFEYIMTFFPIISELEVSSQTIPAEGTYRYETIEEMSVILPDYKANKKILKETIGK